MDAPDHEHKEQHGGCCMSHNITMEEIEHYWQYNTINYAIFTNKTMHYGLWYDNTESSEEAHENSNEFVIEKLGINSDDKVLDAGCGVGWTITTHG